MRFGARTATFISLAGILVLLPGMVTAKTTKSAKRSSHSTVSAHAKSGKHVRHSRRARHKNASWKRRGQQRIAPERAREIQEALIRQNYMEAPATGVWDDSSRQAMIKYQEDHGWQTKSVPDSRALIELGLGPDHDHLINPESAMTMRPHGGIAEKENVSGPAALPQ